MAEDRKSIFITGAASGIGRETARLFAEKGWLAGLYDTNGEGLEALRAELGGACISGVLDVTDKPAYDAAVAEFGKGTGGRLDLLFNNAGIGVGGQFGDVAYEDHVRVVAVNFMGVLNGIHAALELLKATPGSLCFTTSSASATYGIPGIAVYSATKHAVKGLTEALSIEFEPFGVRAADVLPGLIDTAILPEGAARNADTEGMFRLTPPRDVAQAVWDAYHDAHTLHWYVPPEIVELDRAKGRSPEDVRTQIRDRGLLRGADPEQT